MYFTIEDLIKDLNTYFASGNENNSIHCLQEALYNYSSHDWKKYMFFDKNTYKKNIIIQEETYELSLICLYPNQKTEIHDHAKNGCVIKVLEGQMDENQYKLINNKPVFEKLKIHNVNGNIYINNQIGLHNIHNNTDQNLVILQLYSPSIYNINTW